MKDYFIYVGRLDKLKGIDILFEAWKLMGCDAPKLLVCGTGPMEDWCKQFLAENPECNIEMKGFVQNSEAKKLIADSKALILPTQWYEGFPMTILEAYSVGTPVIGSDIGNVGNLIEEGITGFKFKYNSADDLIRATKLLDDNVLSAELIKSVFSDKYSERKNIEMLEEIYQKSIYVEHCGVGGGNNS